MAATMNTLLRNKFLMKYTYFCSISRHCAPSSLSVCLEASSQSSTFTAATRFSPACFLQEFPLSLFQQPLISRHSHDCCARGDCTEDYKLRDRQCWKCDRMNGTIDELFFCHCGFIQKVPSSVNYYDVFRIYPWTFDIDVKKLADDYKVYQQHLHPDRYVGKSEYEKELSDELSSLMNNAYRMLLKPLSRGLYLLELNGAPLEEGTQVMDPDFLMEVMETNERIMGDTSETDAKVVWKRNSDILRDYTEQVSVAFKEQNISLAKSLLTKMKYYSNIEDKLKEISQREGWQFDDE